MRNPNGFGTVVKLSGNRRRPYAARKTVGWNEKGYPIIKCIGYAETREEALIMLAEYNKSPYDLDKRKITTEELFELWLKKNAEKLPRTTVVPLRGAWNFCESVKSMRYAELRAYHMQECIDTCGLGYASQAKIKNLFYHLDRYALELDIITKQYSALLTIAPVEDSDKKPFTEEEISRAWEHSEKPGMDAVITLLYTGWRVSELLALKPGDIDLEQGTMRGGTKTKSGKNRIVPIHPRILPFIESRVRSGNEYCFGTENGKKLTINSFYPIWHQCMYLLGTEHTPHECRHTFRSRLDSAGANKKCIDLLMGHKSKDVGERIYTHKTLTVLRDTIILLK